jgi:aminoglycoside phosphotransferase (APT) family kinase protein
MSEAELAAVLRAVRIHSEDSFSFPAGAPAVRAESLTVALTHALYTGAFAFGPGEEPRDAGSIAEAELTRWLSRANRSRDRWCDGWRIAAIEPSGAIVATCDGRQRTAKPGEYALTFARDLPPQVGMAAMLFFPRESLTLQAHVYYALGETLPDGQDASRPIRFYVRAPVDALPELYERLTGELNRRELPFTLKTMLAPRERDRRDATVLYVPREHCTRVEAILRALPEALRARLGPGVPLFTRPVAPGIGMAESPGGGESFGMQRSRLVAEGIVDAWSAGAEDEESRMHAVRQRFAAAGIDWNQPYRDAAPRVVLTAANVAEWLAARYDGDGGAWSVSDRSSRNHNFAVTRADGSGWFVKQLRVQVPASLRMMQREAAILAWAAANDDVRHLLPAPAGFDAHAQALTTELLAGAESVATIADRQTSTAIALAAARSLALLHRQTPPRSPLFERRPPDIYTAHRGGPLLQWLGAGQMQIVDRVRESAILAPALDRMAAEWRAEHLIHGDVKWENCLWTASTGRMHWIDWELADAGDPLWDAGCFVQAYLARWPDVDRRALDVFIDAYAPEARPAILRCAAARLVQTSLEVMHGQPRPTPLALRHLHAAEELMHSGLPC